MDNTDLSLERIANALEIIAKHYDPNFIPFKTTNAPNQHIKKNEPNFITHSPQTLEEELFILTTNIYLEETKRKSEENLKRKSSIKVSKNLLPMQVKFLKKYLFDYNLNEGPNNTIIISKTPSNLALIRFYTDLGFYRGNEFKNEINNMMSIANNLNIPNENIFFIILSNLNSLDKQHVCSALNKDISNKDILSSDNLHYLKKYCDIYINSFNDILKTPTEQIFFLASSLHPNRLANEIFDNNHTKIDLLNYKWISTPLNDLIEFIKSL